MTTLIGIGGSSRKGGNTDILLDEALRGAADTGAEVDRVHIADLAIGRCLACGGCAKTGVCVVKDDAPELLERMWAADALLVSTPIYFMGPPSQLKALIDRGQSMWVRTFQKTPPEERKKNRKPAGLIMIGGMNFGYMFDPTAIIVKAFYASMGFKLTRELSYKKIDAPGAIRDHETAMSDAYDLGKSLATETQA